MNLTPYAAFALTCMAMDLPALEPPSTISPDGRYLETASGQVFPWIGDTAWELFHVLDREEAIHYLDTRAEQGFTLIQAVILAEQDGLRIPNAYGDLPLKELDPTRPNEAYFAHVDFIVEAAAQRGLVMGLLPTWGDKVKSVHPTPGPEVFNPENARHFAAFLGHRYRDQPVVWILGGDRNVSFPEAREVWEAMGQALKESTGGHQLITYHPRGAQFSGVFFHDAAWLDFNMYQSGHEAHAIPVFRYASEAALFRPRKPFVDGEPAYEDIPVRFWNYINWSKPGMERVPDGVLADDGLIADQSHFTLGFITAHDVRRHAYWNLLSGAAGYTYGNNAVWQMFRRNGRVILPTLTDWRDALRRPGAEDMRHVRDLWAIRPFDRLCPDQAFIIWWGEPPRTPDRPAAAVAPNGSYALLYLPTPATVTVAMSKIEGPRARAWWFNPRNGDIVTGGEYPADKHRTFTSPTSAADDDWILVLENPDAELPKTPSPGPGQ